MEITHDQVFDFLGISKRPMGHPQIHDYVVNSMARRIEKMGEAWARKNARRLRTEMTEKYHHMASRAKAMGLPDLTYGFASGGDIGGLLGFLAGNHPVRSRTYPGVEPKGPMIKEKSKPKRKKRWLTYESSSPKSHGLLSKAFWRKKSPIEII